MISFDFDRAKMRRRLTFYSISSGAFLSILFPGYWASSHVYGISWAGWLVLAIMFIVGVPLIQNARWVGAFGRGLKRKGAAVIVNKNGIVDNASDCAVGSLAWDEIETMYRWDLNSRLLVNWWERMPVISRQRGIVVILKDSANLQRLLLAKPRLIRLLSKQWYVSGRRRWLFIPEAMLTVSADELMRRLNLFYVTEVRR